ncbi:carbonic anhydrase [Roseobacteraceae bacterium S113]
MPHAKPLPGYLVNRYHGWKATSYEDNAAWYQRLAAEGQRPRAMVISCCDSRVNVMGLFGAVEGEFFIHRNIANLVPPYVPNGDHHGTSAAIEYGVTALRVTDLIVLGHSQCGGVRGCIDMCKGHSPELEATESFVGRWMEILKPAYPLVEQENDAEVQATALEKHSIRLSLENLMTFPFVKAAVEADKLALHGLWTDIGAGVLEELDVKSETFRAI